MFIDLLNRNSFKRKQSEKMYSKLKLKSCKAILIVNINSNFYLSI